MAASGRSQDPPLNRAEEGGVHPHFDEVARLLKAEPWTFDFFQAVWLLERIRGGSPHLGHFQEPGLEPVRFAVHQSLSFPASSIQGLDSEQAQWKLLINFLGLTGPSGVLPQFYTYEIMERARIRDYTLRDFLDIFNHRSASLFYRAWMKYRLAIRYPFGLDDPLLQSLLCVVGLGTRNLTARHEVDDETFLWYAGLLSLQPRSAVALEQLLGDYFQVPVRVEQFIGAWYRLEGDSTCNLSEDDDPSECLGLGAVVGDEVFDHQARVRVRLGPLTLEQYSRFLPGESGYRRLRELTRLYARDQLDFEVQLVLSRHEVPQAVLPAPDAGAARLQLGWTTWAPAKAAFPRDPEDAILLLQ